MTWSKQDHCKVCVEEAEARRQATERAEKRRLELQRLHDALDLPPRFRNADLATYPCSTDDQRAAVAACQHFVDGLPNDGPGLILIGPPGTGKTTLAAATCRAAIDQRGCSAHLVSQRRLIRAIRASWQRDATETEDQVLRKFVSVALLVVDDAGVGYGSEGEMVQLLDVVDGRYQQQRPTMLCTNLSVTQLAKALGDRCFDRLREGARFVVCDWTGHRAAKGMALARLTDHDAAAE